MLDELDDRIRTALHAEVAELSFAITPRMLEERLAQRAHRSSFAIVAGTAVVGAVLAGIVVALGLLTQTPNIGPPASPTPTAAPASVQRAMLAWEQLPIDRAEQVLFTGDGFLLIRSGEAPALTSVDGLEWEEMQGEPFETAGNFAAWDGAILAWTDSMLELRRPDGSSVARMFEVPITEAAIGPAGIVVMARSPVDETVIVEEVLGRQWSEHMRETCMCAPGRLTITRDDGQSADIVLADHGYVGMLHPEWRGGWLSMDGEEWTPLPDHDNGGGLDPRVLVGFEGGFAAQTEDALWHSADGLDWKMVDELAVDDIDPWRGGVVAVDFESADYVYWSPDGGGHTLGPDLDAGFTGFEAPVSAAGPLGIVTVDRSADRLLFSPDGQKWSVTTMPASRDWSTEFAAWGQTSIAVGHDAIVMLLWEWQPDGREVPSLWRGTVAR